MKTKIWFVGLLWLLSALLPALADGFIIIHDPLPVPPIYPPIRPPMPPPHRTYVFAPLEVSYHHVNVRIKEQVAVTSVDQEFYNSNPRQLEGTYIFPVPKGAQIDKFSMEIGGKEVEAELLAADKARKIYEDIVRSLKDPALLEYAGQDVFKVRIFPIEPNSRKRIKLSYTQVLKADGGLVNYLYPLNTEKFSAKPIKTVSLKIDLETRQALKSIYSPSHTVEIRRLDETRATIGFESREVKPDTDFQLLFSTAGSPVGLNLMTYKPSGAEDGFFLLLATPGTEAKGPVARKDVALVLDTSGSMAGNKLEQAKKALLFCIENLNAGDRFEIVRFSTEAEPLFDRLVEANAENRKKASSFVKDLRPIGSTAIDEALAKAVALRPAASDRPYLIIFLTDGRPTIGLTDEDQIVSRVGGWSETGGNTRIFCFGLGSDVNTHLLDKITEKTHAVSQYVLPEEDLEVKLSTFYSKISDPVLTQTKLQFPPDIRVNRLHPSSLPDLFKGDQLILAGRYHEAGAGKLVLEGRLNQEIKRIETAAHFPEQATGYDFIPRLWATRRIGYLLDEIRLRGENKELKDEITELARQYGVVTPYTSYLIVEDETRRKVPVMERTFVQGAGRAGGGSAQDWSLMQRDKSGADATAMARYGLALKSAEAPAAAMDSANRELNRAPRVAASAPMPSRYGMSPGGPQPSIPVPVASTSASASPAPGNGSSSSAATRYIGGRTFYQKDNQWVDALAQKLPDAKRIRIRFDSPEYYDLILREKETLSWLALGRNLVLVVSGKVYEIHE